MWSSRPMRRALGPAALAVLLAGCGFQLRGSYELPYASVFVSAASTSQVASNIRRELTGTPTRVLPSGAGAEGQLNILEERRERQILSLSGAGRVREFELKTVVRYQLVDGKGAVLIPTSEIQLSRILTYDDTKIIAKQQEEAMLYADMDKDVVGQILRRMVAVKRAQ
jgi:LPS-assembly lipoprotein